MNFGVDALNGAHDVDAEAADLRFTVEILRDEFRRRCVLRRRAQLHRRHR